MEKHTVGFAMCGSFCTMEKAVEQMEKLSETYDIIPIMSPIVYSANTRFTDCSELKRRVKNICKNEIIHDITGAEPIGPKKLLDLLIVCPCTGNTLGKLANGITDTSVTMAVKAHLRNDRPVVLALATNDALSASAANIGRLLNTKNYYFVPFGQDDAEKKPTSLIADFGRLSETVQSAFSGKAIKPVLI